jgi:hypothetical protein
MKTDNVFGLVDMVYRVVYRVKGDADVKHVDFDTEREARAFINDYRYMLRIGTFTRLELMLA